MNPTTRYLLVIIGVTTVSFAPTSFASDTACKAAASIIAAKSADAVSDRAGIKLSCVPVESDR